MCVMCEYEKGTADHVADKKHDFLAGAALATRCATSGEMMAFCKEHGTLFKAYLQGLNVNIECTCGKCTKPPPAAAPN